MGLQVRASKLLNAAIATGAGESLEPLQGPLLDRTFQATGQTSSGAGSVTVDVEVSDDKANWIVQRTITLTLSSAVSTDGYTTRAPWKYVRGNVTAISGTGAAVTLWIGILM